MRLYFVVLFLLVALAGCTRVAADVESITPVYGELGEAMIWLDDNTAEDAKVLSWWDYAKTIKELGHREPVLTAPSKDILFTVAMYASKSKEELEELHCPDCESHDKVMTVVDAFLSKTSVNLQEAADTHGADYVMVTNQERQKLYALLQIKGMDVDEYMEDYRPIGPAWGLVVLRMTERETLEGFELVYADDSVSIYRRR